MYNQKDGITLIALIITIIVLLILAGVVVNLSLGENGIIKKAQTAVDKYKQAAENEQIEIAKIENEIDSYVGGNRDYATEINGIKDRITELENVTRNTKNTMSGTEHFVGEYYLNGKPIYEKTFYIASLPSNTTKTWYNHNIANVDEIWFDFSASFIKWTSGEVSEINYPDSFTSNGVNAIIVYDLNNTKFAIKTGTDRSSVSAYITLRYTKTTNTATITPNVTTLTANP